MTRTAQNQAPHWQLHMLGELRASAGGATVEKFPTQKTAALLGMLAYYPTRRHTREGLIDVLWPDADLPAGRDRLSQALVWLRRHLEPPGTPREGVLLADRFTVGLNPEAVTTDVARFEAAIAAAQGASDPHVALQEAVTLYGGDLLPGQYADWVITERRRLHDAYLGALHELTLLCARRGDYVQAAAHAQRAIAADPLREEAHADLIALLAETGQTAAAMRQYRELTALLSRELDSAPSPATQALVERLSEAVPRPEPARPRANLARIQAPLTRLFGRQEEIARVRRLLLADSPRLVSLVGAGGTGKTRLAVAVAAAVEKEFVGGFAHVALADLTDPRNIPGAIAGALGMPASNDTTLIERIADRLAPPRSLLLLDNAEHLVTAVAAVVSELLRNAPGLSVLVTTRQRLGVEGEQEVPVTPLPLADAGATPDEVAAAPSVQLFVDRARAVRPEFAVTPANAALIARICERLDGVPLAIELCAAWAQTLTPAQMLAKLDHRFDLLVSRRTDITPRHRSLRAALEYSLLQLPPNLSRLFALLSVFRGGWNLAAAEAVCLPEGATSELGLLMEMTELRERSLLLADEVDVSGAQEMRYRMTETLREFAAEQLSYADRQTHQALHADWFLEMAEQAAAADPSPEQETWFSRMDLERENLRAAVAWAIEAGQAEVAVRICGAMGPYWFVRGNLREGTERLQQALALPLKPGEPPIGGLAVARAWGALGHLLWQQSEFLAARQAHLTALELRRDAGDQIGIADSLFRLGITAYRRDEFEEAERLLDEALAISQRIGDRPGYLRALHNLGNIAYEREDYGEAGARFQECLKLARELGNRQRVADALNNLGIIACDAEHDYAASVELLEECLALRRDLKDHYGAAIALFNLARAARLGGDPRRAVATLRQGLDSAYQIGNKHIVAHMLLEFGQHAFQAERLEDAVYLMSAANGLRNAIGSSFSAPEEQEMAAALDSARARMGDEAFHRAADRGSTVEMSRIIDWALR